MPVLSWEGRERDVRRGAGVDYHVLSGGGVFGDGGDNLLIQGDNLAALKSLLPHYAGKVKCVFIDPPYNTGSAFTHYDDNLAHTQWLELMYPRLVLLRDLLAADGSMWVTIDDNEAHYLKVIMDEIFGRKNFIINFIWEKKRKASFLGKQVGGITDHILCYSKNKEFLRPFTFGLVSENETWPLYNPGNKRAILEFAPNTVQFLKLKDGDYGIKEYAEKTSVIKLIQPLKIANGWNANTLCIEGEWRYSQKTINEQLKMGENYIVKSEKFRPRRVLKFNVKDKKIHNLLSRTHYNMATNEDAATEILNLFGAQTFDYPKPEGLINFIVETATKPGDLVLDSFLGSGTTAAVAHKMERQYIGIEMGEHAKTHCIPRLQKVIDGEQGGISESCNWHGGGGFCFMTLGESVFDEYGNINPKLKFDELAAHIWFYETKTPLPSPKQKTPFLGTHRNTGIAVLYNGILKDKSTNGGNVLTAATLAKIRAAAPKKFHGNLLIYGNGCRLKTRRLTRENIKFRQIPYDCKHGDSK